MSRRDPDSSLLALAAADCLLLVITLARSCLLPHLPREMASWLFPASLIYLIPLEKGALVLASFMFIIFTGGRHLNIVNISQFKYLMNMMLFGQIEKKSYRCLNATIFCAIISILITVSSYFELETVNMTGEEIKMELEVNNVTVDMSELLITADNNTVAVHTELFSHVTYSQLVRLLFNFMSSQVRISQK